MAVLWEHFAKGTHYEVTRAGNSIRLYSNRVFHSQWNARSPICGQLWESLLLPAFFLDLQRPLRVLLLGVGGGAVVNLLNHFLEVEKLVGVELDPVHLKIARRWFKSEQANVNYYCDDAVAWLKTYKGPRFNLIIEDLFMSDTKGEVLRAVPADVTWLKLLGQHLSASGILAMNFESARQARDCWQKAGKETAFAHAGLLSSMRNENAIAVFGKKVLDLAKFRANLQRWPELDTRNNSCKLDFRFQKLRST